jgi:hypothetical protein
MMSTGLIWLMVWTCGGLLGMRLLTYGFHKMRGGGGVT